jgi:MFS family permease
MDHRRAEAEDPVEAAISNIATTTDASGPINAESPPYGSVAYRWYVVVVMMLVYACHAMDRSLPGVLAEPIRNEFGLTDAQLGLVTGPAYGFAFALAILPMGLLSDRMNRRTLLATMVIVWSVCTAFVGISRSYVQLFLARVGIGAAEAATAPVAIPLISDIFPPERRGFALGIYYMSSNLGVFFAGAVGGLVAATFGWRAAFLVVSVPGILIALLVLFTVREPMRGATDNSADEAAGAPAPSFLDVLRFLGRTPAIICMIIGYASVALVSVTMSAWAGSFFIRVHGLSLAQVGLVLGVGGGLIGMISSPGMGWLADRLSLRDSGWPIRLVWLSLLLALAAGLAMVFSPILSIAIAGYVLSDVFRSGFPPVVFSVIMANTPGRMRGSVTSFVQLATIFVSFGIGPSVIGLLSDLYGGGVAIRYALATALVMLPVAVLMFIAGSRLLAKDPKAGG